MGYLLGLASSHYSHCKQCELGKIGILVRDSYFWNWLSLLDLEFADGNPNDPESSGQERHDDVPGEVLEFVGLVLAHCFLLD